MINSNQIDHIDEDGDTFVTYGCVMMSDWGLD